jgi:hypothetical protein
MYLLHTSTHFRKQVYTQYILEAKRMYQVYTLTCRFIVVPYYSMVHTGMYSVHTGTYNSSGFQMVPGQHNSDLNVYILLHRVHVTWKSKFLNFKSETPSVHKYRDRLYSPRTKPTPATSESFNMKLKQ